MLLRNFSRSQWLSFVSFEEKSNSFSFYMATIKMHSQVLIFGTEIFHVNWFLVVLT